MTDVPAEVAAKCVEAKYGQLYRSWALEIASAVGST